MIVLHLRLDGTVSAPDAPPWQQERIELVGPALVYAAARALESQLRADGLDVTVDVVLDLEYRVGDDDPQGLADAFAAIASRRQVG